MNSYPTLVFILLVYPVFFAGCNRSGGADSPMRKQEAEKSKQKILVTSPIVQDVTSYQEYVCQIHSCKHIEVHALESGYLEEILVAEGQSVKQGEVMFRLLPKLKKASLDAKIANAKHQQIEFENTNKLAKEKVVSVQEVKLAQAALDQANAEVELARSELEFMEIKAAFDGVVDRQLAQQGSLINEGDLLTWLSDNSVMWVYFNVPEARYLEYAQTPDFTKQMVLELVLANHTEFPERGHIGAIETTFDNQTGNIMFRGNFPNPKNVLRHGQTGTVKIPTKIKDAIVIPQRATFNILDRRYVYAIEDKNTVKQRAITVEKELEDIFVVSDGLSKDDKFVFEGVRQVRDGEKIEFEFKDPQQILASQKYHAE